MEFDGKSLFVLKIFLLLNVVYNGRLGLVRVVLADDSDIWPFDDLTKDMNKFGNASNSDSPMGKGLYLDGSQDTYVEIKGHNKNCMEHPSNCNISVGLFFKMDHKSGRQLIFGNHKMPTNKTILYEGVNIFYDNNKIHMLVYGQEKFCQVSFHPPLGVWFYMGLVWERAGKLALKVDSWFTNRHSNCGNSPDGLLTNGDYSLGKETFPIAYYKDLTVWYSKQSSTVLQEKWTAAFYNGINTCLRLKIIFSDVVYDSGSSVQWQNDFTAEMQKLFSDDANFQEVVNVLISNSGGNAAISFNLKFQNHISWETMLALQLALENGTFFGSRGVFDEDGCSSQNDNVFFCQVPRKPRVWKITYHQVFVKMNPVLQEKHEGYFYAYRLLYKNLDIPESSWRALKYRRNVVPINPVVHSLASHTNYSFRVMASSFHSEGLISEAFQARTTQWVPSVGPEIVVYYNTSPSSFYVQWNHTIPENKWNGILIGYRVWWNDDVVGNPQTPTGHKDLGLDATNHTIINLHEYWCYEIGVAGRTAVGQGISTTRTVMTPDDAPSAPPANITLDMHNSSTLVAHWQKVPLIHQNGIILGYQIQLQHEEVGPIVWNVTSGPNETSFNFTDLSIYQNYSLQIMAYNRKGEGPYSDKIYQMTDGAVPINSPTNLRAQNISATVIQVYWNYNEDPRLVLGDLSGFTLFFHEANVDDTFTSNGQLLTHARGINRTTLIEGLKIFRLYNVSIAARTNKGVGPINESVIVRTDGKAPGASPQSLVVQNTSSFSIYLRWSEVVSEYHYGIMRGYKLSIYKRTAGGFESLENRTNGLSPTEANFTGLTPFTTYKVEVLGFNDFGDGPSTALQVLTDESYPSQPPSNFTASNESSTTLRLFWKQVPECCLFGITLGYHMTLTDPNNASMIVRKTTTLLTGQFFNLKKFHKYDLTIEAFNSKGSSPKAFTSVFTDQDVPEAPPQNISGNNISKSEILVFWKPVPKDKVNGIVTAYNVTYSKIAGNPHSGCKTFNGSSSHGVIDGLLPFTVYSLNVSASTVKGQGPASPAITVKTEEEAPQVSPARFTGFNTSSTSIGLSWDPIPEEQVAGVLRNFYITYRQLNTADNTTNTIAVPITNLSFELTYLRKYTNYSLQVKGATKFFGIPTEPIIITTDEDIPSLPPQNIKIQNSSSTSISARWKPIPKDSVHGILLGIKLMYQSAPRDNSIAFRSRSRRSVEESWSEYTNITLPPNALSHELTSLKKFTNYSIFILGFTVKGDGNVSQQFVLSTDEDVPSKPPTALFPMSRSGDFRMNVTWGQVPDGCVHGILRGYRLYFKKTRETGRVTSSATRVITFGPNEHLATVTLLNNFAMYSLEITAFTIKGEGPRTEIEEGATCKCPRVFKTNWHPFSPYLKFENGTLGGFMPHILEHAVEYCCSDCKQANGRSASIIDFEFDGKGNFARKSGVDELINNIDSDTDFSLPVNGYEGQTHYSLYRYVKLAESPGVAFITVIDENEKIVAVANVFLNSWSVLLLSAFMMVMAGVVMWILDTRSNRAEFPGSFIQGAYEGFWWAFVTSTTVGYGDKCPRGVMSRLFGITWTLSGLVVIAILTGTIATALTGFGVDGPYISLYGTKVAAISNNSDFRLGIRKNAKMSKEHSYKTYEEISQALANKEVKGALVDLYVLSSHKHLFEDPRFRIVRIYDYKASYGVVLTGHSMKLEECFTEHIKSDAAEVYESIEENIKILREPPDSPAEQQSTGLFDATSSKYIIAVTVTGALLILACVLGIIFEKCREKTPKAYLKQSKDLKNDMSPIIENFQARMKKIVQDMLKRHRRQQCAVMHVEKDRERQAAALLNQYYDMLSSRDIHRDWFIKRPVQSNIDIQDIKPTVWPFLDTPKTATVITKTYDTPRTPLFMKRSGLYRPNNTFTVEPNVRVFEDSKL